jgi:TonB family protein
VGVFVFLVLFLLSAAAPSPAQTLSASPGAIQSNQPTSQPASPANGVTLPIAIVPQNWSQNCAYPPIAVRLNQQGTTIVTVHVTAKGTVADVTVKATSGHEALDMAAVRCATAQTYRPATQNGIAVEAYAERAMRWTLEGGTSPPPVPFLPPSPPTGWEREGTSQHLAGILVSYKLSQAPTAEQYLSAGAYLKFSDLGDFVAKNDTNLQSIRGLHLLGEEQATICGREPASEVEYSQSGLVSADPDRILDVDQVRTVKNGWAFVTTYIRPAESPKRPDAEQWIRMYCDSRG